MAALFLATNVSRALSRKKGTKSPVAREIPPHRGRAGPAPCAAARYLQIGTLAPGYRDATAVK